MPKQQRIRDPLHDLIEFNVEKPQVEGVLWRVISPYKLGGETRNPRPTNCRVHGPVNS